MILQILFLLINISINSSYSTEQKCKKIGGEFHKRKCRCENEIIKSNLGPDPANFPDRTCRSGPSGKEYHEFRKILFKNYNFPLPNKEDKKNLKEFCQIPGPQLESRKIPPKQQQCHGVCHGLVASTLLEETLCLEKHPDCGKALSTIHLLSTRKTGTTIGIKGREGGDALEALKDVHERGVCLEKYAPYPDTCGEMEEITKRHLLFLKQKTCIIGKMKTDFERLKEYQCNRPAKKIDEAAEQLYNIIKFYPTDYPVDKETFYEILTSENWPQFFDKLVISSLCKENLIKKPFEKYRNYYKDFPITRTNNNDSFYKKVWYLKNLLPHQSMAMYTCMTIDEKGKCAKRHLMVAEGLEWKNGKCQIRVRNWWGLGTEDFIPLSDINHVERMGHFSKVPENG